MFEPGTYRIATDLLRIRGVDGELHTRSWGDRLKVTGADATGIDVFIGQPGRVKPLPADALVKADLARAPQVLKVDFVDVQQGDAAVLETAGGTTMLVDGGENLLFARYLASRFAGTTAAKPKPIDCVVVTHGDADHFAGLTRIRASEDEEGSRRLFLAPKRIFHNGLVKGEKAPHFGEPVPLGRKKMIVDLHDDLRPLPDTVMNGGFRDWRDAVQHWSARGQLDMRRLERGTDSQFDFLAGEGVRVQVLGPVTFDVGGRRGLPTLSSPAHTINGHSVVLLVRFGNVRFLLAGDLNAQAEKALVADHDAGQIDLTAEVLKVPHHGSADFSGPFLARVAPGVSVVSSGDEREHIHPRATLMAALGRHARPSLPEPVIFVTELAAFFKSVGKLLLEDGRPVWAFKRNAFGIVRCRTDGNRLLVYTETGVKSKNEAYAYTVAGDGTMAEAKARIVG